MGIARALASAQFSPSRNTCAGATACCRRPQRLTPANPHPDPVSVVRRPSAVLLPRIVTFAPVGSGRSDCGGGDPDSSNRTSGPAVFTNGVGPSLAAAAFAADDTQPVEPHPVAVAGSYWSGDASDYVLVNFNLVPGGFAYYDAGVVRYPGGANYTTESTATSGWLANPNGSYGPYSLSANRILNLVEVFLPAGQTGIHLMNETWSVDWGVSLHRADMAYQGKTDVLGTACYAGGSGGNEVLVADVPSAGWYCLAVWKTTASELAKAGTYKLLINPVSVSGVDDHVPSPKVTELVGITPNPFNPQTKITCDLAREGQVRLEVYDVQGRLVRTLVDSARDVGRHTETRNGADDSGGRVASGVYLARLTAGGVTGMMKMMLLK
jgi:hypothetical protein